MAKAVVTFKIMPDDVEADLDAIQEAALKKIVEFSENEETKVSREPVAFGLEAIKIIFVMDEGKGNPEDLEQTIQGLDGIMSCECTDVRRAIG